MVSLYKGIGVYEKHGQGEDVQKNFIKIEGVCKGINKQIWSHWFFKDVSHDVLAVLIPSFDPADGDMRLNSSPSHGSCPDKTIRPKPI